MMTGSVQMGRIRYYIIGCICCLLLLTVADGRQQSHRRSRSAKHKSIQAPPKQVLHANYGSYDFSMKSIDGKKIHLASYSGNVVLVSIWSPSCGPCKTETPGLVRLYRKYHSKGFEIIGVAVQTNETEVRSFVLSDSIPWVTGVNDSIAASYGMYGLPDHYLFAMDGNLIKHFVGYTREDVITPSIDKALKGISSLPPGKKK
jgi:thioredoxin-like negative regulator of GroEL